MHVHLYGLSQCLIDKPFLIKLMDNLLLDLFFVKSEIFFQHLLNFVGPKEPSEILKMQVNDFTLLQSFYSTFSFDQMLVGNSTHQFNYFLVTEEFFFPYLSYFK